MSSKAEPGKRDGTELIGECNFVYHDSTPEFLLSLIKIPIKISHLGFKAIIDTGSTISIMHPGLLNISNVKPIIKRRRMVRLLDQSLTQLDFVQQIEVEVDGKKFKHDFHLWDKLEGFDVLLGQDFCYKAELCIDFAENIVYLDGRPIIEFEVEEEPEKDDSTENQKKNKELIKTVPIDQRKYSYSTKKEFPGLLKAIENFENEQKRLKAYSEWLKEWSNFDETDGKNDTTNGQSSDIKADIIDKKISNNDVYEDKLIRADVREVPEINLEKDTQEDIKCNIQQVVKLFEDDVMSAPVNKESKIEPLRDISLSNDQEDNSNGNDENDSADENTDEETDGETDEETDGETDEETDDDTDAETDIEKDPENDDWEKGSLDEVD